ncbi:restriction endonuclease [Litoribacillus peritrichatus]|uniref:Restriction endonuclease type IV Mrr domain-containing protein n=1 Tax=Litoribacillus peritrichatus TaxID=718191 RepID=A0ABP7MBL5_9GAMM
MNLLNLSPAQFEGLTFDIVSILGLRNVVWRTPGSDGGRDIEGMYYISDLSGYHQKQKWYVECKRYTGSVDWPTVWNKISYAESNNADVLFFVTTSSLTPQAVDNVARWNRSDKKPIIRFWGKVDVVFKLNLYPQLACKYGLQPSHDSHLPLFDNIVDLLIKVSHSLSPESGEATEEKLFLLHALSELLSVRMADVSHNGRFIFRPHRLEDSFDWFDYRECNVINFDRSALRATLSYINFILKEQYEAIRVESNVLELGLQRQLIESELFHLNAIANSSNFIIRIDDDRIYLEITVEINNGQ